MESKIESIPEIDSIQSVKARLLESCNQIMDTKLVRKVLY